MFRLLTKRVDYLEFKDSIKLLESKFSDEGLYKLFQYLDNLDYLVFL